MLLNRNYGQHAAIMAGFAESKGEIVVTLDADLQNPPEEIPKLVQKMEEGFDVVGSVRVHRRDTLFRRWLRFVINKVVQKVTGVHHARLRLHAAGLPAEYREGHAGVSRAEHLYPGAGQQLCP